jgi:hypothetical protein
MSWNTWILACIITLGLAATSQSQAGRKISRCKIHNKDVTAPQYKLGITYEAPSKVPSRKEDGR